MLTVNFNMVFMSYKFDDFVMLTNYSFNLLSKMVKRNRLQSKTSKKTLMCKDTTDNKPKRRKITRSNKLKNEKQASKMSACDNVIDSCGGEITKKQINVNIV